MKHFCSIWSQRLIIYTYIAVSLGLHTGSQVSEKLSVAMHKRNEDDDVEKSSTGTDRDEVRKARSQFNNVLEFTAVAMQDYLCDFIGVHSFFLNRSGNCISFVSI